MALASLIDDTRARLAEAQYAARVAQRQARVAKASHGTGGETKYAAVRYTMVK